MLEIGSFLSDRYEILSKVGAGGMSDVYKAKDHILSRFVAIKVLKQEFSEDSSFVTKFRAEAQSAAGLEHPNIVNIYDVGSENGLYYIVMEYVEGITLKTYIEKKGQLSFKESASIAIQVARGIEAAKSQFPPDEKSSLPVAVPEFEDSTKAGTENSVEGFSSPFLIRSCSAQARAENAQQAPVEA